MESEELQEDYGDVSTWKCPSCGCIDYDEELFEIVE